ncbi:hypothetical protein JCM10212_004247 [Sporobolomyces blumeae]
MFSSSYPSSDMPPSAPPSSSSPTSLVRYFDLLPNELVRLIVEHISPLRAIAQPLLAAVIGILEDQTVLDCFDLHRGRTRWLAWVGVHWDESWDTEARLSHLLEWPGLPPTIEVDFDDGPVGLVHFLRNVVDALGRLKRPCPPRTFFLTLPSPFDDGNAGLYSNSDCRMLLADDRLRDVTLCWDDPELADALFEDPVAWMTVLRGKVGRRRALQAVPPGPRVYTS